MARTRASTFGCEAHYPKRFLIWVASSLFLGAALTTECAAGDRGKRPVTVRDCIEMTKLADPSYWIGGSSSGHVATYSPDGTKFIVVLRKGNVEDNTNEYSMLLWNTDDLFESAKPVLLLKMSSSSNREAIKQVTWMADNESVMFIGEQPGRLAQVYSFNIRTHNLAMLTTHPTNVVAYSATPRGDKIAYVASKPPESIWDAKTRRNGLTLSSEFLWNLMASQRRDAEGINADRDLLLESHDRINMPFDVKGKIDVPPYGQGPSLSPDGKYILIAVHPAEVPESWKEYSDPTDPEMQQLLTARVPRSHISYARRYVLIDPDEKSSRILLDSPIASSDSKVAWLPESNSVAISGVYLPLGQTIGKEREIRKTSVFTVEVNLSSGNVTTIAQDYLKLIGWNEKQKGLIFGSRGSTEGEVGTPVLFRKNAEEWEKESNGIAATLIPEITLEEDKTTRPRIFATDSNSGRKAMLVDLNPQFDDLSFGKVQEITWKDPNGRETKGGLYYPIDYVPGKRYPLVIQTHGWYPHRFCIDGPWTTAFAAQPLAGSGFAVLQVQDPEEDLEMTPEEVKRGVAAIEGAIDYLDSIGLIDRGRVGLIGFSRSGLQVRRALTHSNYHFAAAAVTDSNDGSYFTYLALNDTAPIWSELYERLNGGSPFGKGIAAWVNNSTGFSLEKVETPLRIVSPRGGTSILNEWEWFAGLSRLGKPVEMTAMEDGDHIMQKPWDRLVDQQGNVDWFRFWLQGYQDPDSAKKEQYDRWRALRLRANPCCSQ